MSARVPSAFRFFSLSTGRRYFSCFYSAWNNFHISSDECWNIYHKDIWSRTVCIVYKGIAFPYAMFKKSRFIANQQCTFSSLSLRFMFLSKFRTTDREDDIKLIIDVNFVERLVMYQQCIRLKLEGKNGTLRHAASKINLLKNIMIYTGTRIDRDTGS